MDEMTEIMMRYIYDWTVDEGLRDALHYYNAKFKCEKTERQIICVSVIPNPGVHEIKVRGPELVAIGDKDVLMGERVIMPMKGGKLKIVTKLYKKRVTPSHSSVAENS